MTPMEPSRIREVEVRVVLDSNVLLQAFGNLKPGSTLFDPRTGVAVTRATARAEALIATIDAHKGNILIPTPVLTELFIGLGAGQVQGMLETIKSLSCFEIVGFDELAAIECARMVTEQEIKNLDPAASKAKLRFDRQILAIALANNADEVWTHDKQLLAKAESLGVRVKSLADIDPIPEQMQVDWST